MTSASTGRVEDIDLSEHLSHEELEQLIRDANERAHNGRLERLGILLSEADLDPAPFPGLAYEYYEEARLCWYVGAFVATIVMSQLALEEVLRSHYRVTKSVGGRLNNLKKVDRAGFADLIRQAEHDGWISSEEAIGLDKLRKNLRNPYVHPKDVSKKNDLSKPSFFTQQVKIVSPELLDRSAKDEAKETIILLVGLLPKLARRFWGMEHGDQT